MDPLWLAMSRYRRGKLDSAITICDEILSQRPGDQAAWSVKCRSVIKQNFIDDIEMNQESVAEMLLDENAVATIARPGTSINAPQTGSKSNGYDQSIRPMTQSGRPVTGFLRPMSSRPTSGTTDIRDALQSRGSTAVRPMTTLGREIRLGTASLSSTGSGPLVDSSKLNIKKYASKTGLAIILTEYLLYVEYNTRKALELCAEATSEHDFKNWWWKSRLGKCYLKLGLLRDAERQFRSALKIQPIIDTYLDLSNVYLRLDVPQTALQLLTEGCQMFTLEPRLVLGIARIHDMLNDQEKAISFYKKVLVLDPSNVEAIACLGAHYFYADQPELSMRYYRRLYQMGINNAELWNNIGLCCFYASQYDMAIGCFDRALNLSSDEEMADTWYNIGHVGIALGDLGMAYQAFKIVISIDPSHGEALNNIGVLEMRRQKVDLAKVCVQSSSENSKHLYEPLFNQALMFYRMGEFQEAYKYAEKALIVYPNHHDSKELLTLLQKMFF